MSERDPLAGMTDDLRRVYDTQPRWVRESYLRWWAERPNKAAAHRDTLEAFVAGVLAHDEMVQAARHRHATVRRKVG